MTTLCSGRLVWPLFGLSVVASASCGITLIVIGIMALTKEEWQLIWLLDSDTPPGVSTTLIVFGILEMGLAALVFFGAHLGKRRIMLAFLGLSLLFLVVVGFFVVGVLISDGQANLIDNAAEMRSSVSRYEWNTDEAWYWDNLQTKYECCGVDGPTDWYQGVPYSCCRDKYASQRCNATYGAYTYGCLTIMTSIEGDYVASIGIASVFAVMMLLLNMAATLALIWS